MHGDLGPEYTKGTSFRARAEARQRAYRAQTLQVAHGRWGHWLDSASAEAGANFVVPEACEAARARQARGKGVDPVRTFSNMLSSQAMCFNLFAPLARDPSLAATVLRRFVPPLAKVRSIAIEHTPAADIFRDQSGAGGVDCDVFIEGLDGAGAPLVVTFETKFVEPEFSTCGFRKPGREAKGQPVCPPTVTLDGVGSACLYTSQKGYLYWLRTRELGTLRADTLRGRDCAFDGPLWQLWVNHTLASAEASRRGATSAIFGVCAPKANRALLEDGGVLDQFRSHLAEPSSLVFVDLDALVAAIRETAEGKSAWHDTWWQGLEARYAAI